MNTSQQDKEVPSLIAVQDALANIHSLNEVVHMAAAGLTREERNAIQAVAGVIDIRLKAIMEMVESLAEAEGDAR
ncbi:hypothetical protein [Xanthobacter sediminis]